MRVKKFLDGVVSEFAAIDAQVSGEDSYLPTPWEELKDQLQNEPSPYWDAYVSTLKQTLSRSVDKCATEDLEQLLSESKCTSIEALNKKLYRKLINRGKKEKIRYRPFDFTHYSFQAYDFTVYGEIIERTGLSTCEVVAYSRAAPYGEQGHFDADHIEQILSEEEFEQARAAGWPASPMDFSS